MRNFQNGRGAWKNFFYSRPVLIFLGLLVLLFAWGVIGFIGKMQTTRENREIAENKVAELEKQKQLLSADITKLQTEEGVEESIREKFGLVKEGESVIVVVEDKNTSESVDEEKGGFFNFLKNLFK